MGRVDKGIFTFCYISDVTVITFPRVMSLSAYAGTQSELFSWDTI